MKREPGQPQTPPAERQAGISDFLTVVFRRKGIIIGLFLVVTFTVGVLALARPVQYVSYGSLLVKRGEQESVMIPGRRIAGWEEELATEAQVVKSETVREQAQKALDGEGGSGSPALRLSAGSIDVQVIGQSNVIEISYAASNAENAHRACDAIVNAYVEYRSASGTLPYPKAFFDAELKRVSAAIDSLTRVRRQFTENQDVVDIAEQRRSLLTTNRDLAHSRSAVSADLAEASSSLSALKIMHQNPDTDVPLIGSGFLNEEGVRDLKRAMLQQETRIAQLEERYRPDAPQLVDARASLESMRLLLRREVEQALQLASARVQGLRARMEALDGMVTRSEVELSTIPAKESRLGDLDHQLTLLRAQYLGLSQDSDRARVTEQTSRRVSVIILSPASPGKVRNTHDYVRLALAPAFSLLIGIGLAFFIDGLDTRLRTAGDVEDTLDLPVLASLNERKG